METIPSAQLMEMLKSPEGKKLLTLLQKDGGTALTKAASAVKQGDRAQAQAALAPLLEGTDAEALVKGMVERLG